MRRPLVLLLAACGTPAAPIDTASWVMTDTIPVEVVEDWPMSWGSRETLDGTDYSVLHSDTIEPSGDPGAPPHDPAGLHVLVNVDEEVTEATFGRADVYVRDLLGTDSPDLVLAPDAPLTVDLLPPVGEPQTAVVSGTVTLGGSPFRVDGGEITYTLVTDDGTVDTPLGPISGCRQYTVAADYQGSPVAGEIWYKPGIGIVAASATSALFGDYGLGLERFASGGAVGDLGVVQAVGLVGPGAPPVVLSTFDRVGALDADKDRHAQMLLEVRWADPVRAATDEQPPVRVDFGTVFGVFPAPPPLRSPISLFGDDDGLGYWEWFVDQAAKNEAVNGIQYQVSAVWDDPGGAVAPGDVVVQARIDYRIWAP